MAADSVKSQMRDVVDTANNSVYRRIQSEVLVLVQSMLQYLSTR